MRRVEGRAIFVSLTAAYRSGWSPMKLITTEAGCEAGWFSAEPGCAGLGEKSSGTGSGSPVPL